MRVKILFLLLFLSFGTFSFAQTDSVDWKNISPELEEFSIDLPESGYFDYRDDEEGKLVRARYSAKSNGNWFYIFSGEDSDQTPLNLLISMAEKNNAKPAQITVDGFKGEKYSFLDSEGFQQDYITIKSLERFYVFHILGFYQNTETAKKFFDSLKLKNPNPVEKSKPEESIAEEKQKEVKINPELAIKDRSGGVEKYSILKDPSSGGGIGSGTGRGSGEGSGLGTGRGDGRAKNPPPPKPVKTSTPIRILGKPKPRYTELARYYNLSGSVLLRVTFLASGRIGSVTPITKLPFGLTTSAISAARQLSFEPPTRNGTPYSVTKRVQYNFTIY